MTLAWFRRLTIELQIEVPSLFDAHPATDIAQIAAPHRSLDVGTSGR